ncbi:hypothetical protein T06_3803 [Trichinella sp. T6]|nr:hypothetical protein T06_3803 [Trichinella sp. T6]
MHVSGPLVIAYFLRYPQKTLTYLCKPPSFLCIFEKDIGKAKGCLIINDFTFAALNNNIIAKYNSYIVIGCSIPTAAVIGSCFALVMTMYMQWNALRLLNFACKYSAIKNTFEQQII